MPMNRSVVMTLLLASLLTFAVTERATAQISLGIKVAGNAVSLDDFQDFSGGFDLGVFLRVGKALYFQPEVSYSFRNTDFLNIIGEFRENYAMRQHFLDIPLLFGFHFVNKKNFKMHFLIGPRVGVLINNHLTQAATVGEMASHLQWGGQFGLGFDIWRFTLDGRYDISADGTSTSGSGSRLQNMFVISLGIKFLK